MLNKIKPTVALMREEIEETYYPMVIKLKGKVVKLAVVDIHNEDEDGNWDQIPLMNEDEFYDLLSEVSEKVNKIK